MSTVVNASGHPPEGSQVNQLGSPAFYVSVRLRGVAQW